MLSESRCKGSNVPSIKSPAADEVRMRQGHLLRSVSPVVEEERMRPGPRSVSPVVDEKRMKRGHWLRSVSPVMDEERMRRKDKVKPLVEVSESGGG